MGESERYQDYKHLDSRSSLSEQWSRNATFVLLLMNALFFLVLMSIRVGYEVGEHPEESFRQSVVRYVALPGDWTSWFQKPWTLLTYMFASSGEPIFSVLANWVWLYVFGDALRRQGGNEWVIPIYLYGGILGAIVFLSCSKTMPIAPMLMGSSVSVMAIATATTFWNPSLRMMTRNGEGYGVPLWVLFLIWLALDSMTLMGRDLSYSLAQVGGILAGLTYAFLLKKGVDAGGWMIRFYRWLKQAMRPSVPISKESMRQRHFYKTGDRPPFVKKPNVNESRIDQILDKINQSGIDSLTDEERQILRQAGNEG
jgi:membrane associated rhomboid family serine protease